MAAVLGVWLGLAGAVAGLTGLRRIRRLRRQGTRTWATAVPQPAQAGDEERLVALEYTLPDGQVLERLAAGNTATLTPGRRVLICYDPDDPQDTLVDGRRGWPVNVAFVAIGAAFVVLAVVIGIFGG